MNFAALILAAEREVAAAEALRASYVTEQTNILATLPDERASLTEAQQARFDELSVNKRTQAAAIDTARARVEALRAEQVDDERMAGQAEQRSPGAATPPGGVQTTSREERTYTAETGQRGVSFFSDTYRSLHKGDTAARDRLERHAREVVIEHESRAIGSGNVGGLLVPQYLVDLVALPLRKGRPFADSVTNVALPAEGMTLNIPRWTSGTTTAPQVTENTAIANVDLVADTDIVVNVRTVAGEQDISRQTLDRGTPGIDLIIFADLVSDYHSQIGNQVINGTGTAGTHLGVRSTAGIGQSSAFGAAITAAAFFRKLAGAIAFVASGLANEREGLEANLITMHPRRWAWLTSLTDTDGRPLVNTENHGPTNVQGLNLNPGKQSNGAGDTGPRVVGEILGLPVITDANIPNNVGTLAEDIVIVSDNTKQLLWEEGDGAPREVQYDQAAASKLQVKLQVYGYSAFTALRRPTAIAIVGGVDTVAGAGLVAPALF